MEQGSLFTPAPTKRVPKALLDHISSDGRVDALIDAGAPVLVCVSGGKDSRLAARAVHAYCRARGHVGDFKLIYANLNGGGVVVTWHDALDQCSRLAADLGVELVIVGRQKGGLLQRWQQRHIDNTRRYCDLELVKSTLPWSTPKMRFCTSELKTAPIQRWIRQTYKGRDVVCVLGIRRAEGRAKEKGRATAPVSKLYVVKEGKAPPLPVGSMDWNAIVEVQTPEVYQILAEMGDAIPDAYTVYGASRYSCCACIMASQGDLEAACRDARNHPVIIAQCALEIESSFSFQGDRWLSDIAYHILPAELRDRLPEAKRRAIERERIEATIPRHLLFENDGGNKTWPKTMPTPEEAAQIARIRQHIGALMGWPVRYTDGDSVMERYRSLIVRRAERDAKAAPKQKKQPVPNVKKGCGQSTMFKV